jgi:hypothetical protein
MIEVVCAFEVKEPYRGQFELAYGPGGAWSGLFGDAPGYRGTSLLRDTRDPRRYLAIEVWDAESQREGALADRAADYARLEATFRDWTESWSEVGIYRVQTEATVRPRGSARTRGRQSARHR